jgi:hypothetical protein
MQTVTHCLFLGPLVTVIGGCSALDDTAVDSPPVGFFFREGQVVIHVGDEPIATYSYADPETSRPYFAHLRAPCGIQVTRNHPPQPGDAQDHKTYHPGIWLAFGDISGSDNWRMKARVEGDGLIGAPQSGPGRGTFTVRNRYLSNDGSKTICTEICQYTLHVRPGGYLLVADSRFRSDNEDFYFGEEMDEQGMSFRVATTLTVKAGQGGRILSDAGSINEAHVRETLGYWCDYSGTIEGSPVGLTAMIDPRHGRRCWWHARDYGFLAANPFRSHDGRAGASRLVVRKGETLRLRFGVWIHGHPDGTPTDPQKAFADFLNVQTES